MTIKQKLFIKHYIDSKGNGTQAAKAAYNVTTDNSAAQQARDVLRSPQVQSALAEYNGLFESALVKTVVDWKDEDDVAKRTEAMRNVRWAYEQIHGKATQRTESVSASFISHTTDKAKQYNLDQ